MSFDPTSLIGYAIGSLSIAISIILHIRSLRKQKERLVRLLDPHVIHQDLLTCRNRILSGKPPWFYRIVHRSDYALYGLHDLRILQQTIKNVQKYILVVRSENYNEYERLLAEALQFLRDGNSDKGIKLLDEAIALLAPKQASFFRFRYNGVGNFIWTQLPCSSRPSG
jgi:hypothetical protein